MDDAQLKKRDLMKVRNIVRIAHMDGMIGELEDIVNDPMKAAEHNKKAARHRAELREWIESRQE